MPFPRNPESEPEIFIALEREDETAKTGNSIPPAPSSTPTIPPRLDGVDKNIEIIAEQISTLFIASIYKLRERGRASTDEKEKKAFNRSSIMAQLTNINTYIDITIEINILAYTFHHVLKEKYTDDTRKTPTFMSSVKKAF